MNERARFIDHLGSKIFMLDFTGCDAEQGMAIVAEAERQIRSQAEKSVVTMVVATGAKFNNQFANSLKDLAAGNEPYVIASAIVGLAGMQSIILNAVSLLSKREFKLFAEVDQAKEYLVKALQR
jgi:hypothetical protein